jgi:hypothetical protein
VALFQESAREGALSTVEEGLNSVPPIGQGSRGGYMKMEQKSKKATHHHPPKSSRTMTNRQQRH